jgi:hypothetical protein
MKDVPGFQPACLGHDSLTRFALPHFFADTIQLRHDAGSGGAVDSAIHSGSAREPRISGVYDCVGFDQGDVTLFEPDHFAGD